MNAYSDSSLIAKAKILTEALPYIQKFRHSIFVIKYGGSFMDEEDGSIGKQIAMDIVLLASVSIHVVVVHGGGKAISRSMKTAGIVPKFVNGLRYTDQATVKVVEETLNSSVNQTVCDLLTLHNGRVRGLRGNDILTCSRHQELDGEGKTIDLGFVADVKAVDTKPILQALNDDCIPVISPLAVDLDGQVYNANADIAASKIAQALGARRLVYLCDKPGLLYDVNDEGSLISTLHIDEVSGLKLAGVIDAGMYPKVTSAVEALQGKVRRVHLISAFVAHSLLLEIFTDQGIGTEIIH